MSLESRLGLKQNERIVMAVRSTPVTIAVPAVFSLAFLLAPFFFLMPLLDWETLGMIIMGISFGIGMFFGIRVAIRWFGTMAVITDRRIFIVQRDGYFARKVHVIPYIKMQGVSYRVKGLWQTMFRYGTVLIRPNAGKPLRIPKIRRPELLEGLIAEAIEEEEGGVFGDLLHAVSEMDSRELKLLQAEIARSLRHDEHS